MPYASNTWKTILEEDAGKPGEDRMERRGGHDAVARAPGKGCVRNPSYGHQGDTHRAGGKRQRLFNFWAQPYTPAGISDSRGTDIGKTGAGQEVEILEGSWEFCLT